MSEPKEYTISGVKVKFPHQAYPSQLAMMSKILTSLQSGQNALLESPTGSGKSLAMLCAALAWQKAEKEKCRIERYKLPPTDDDIDANGLRCPKIYFGTRTHKQVTQLVRELRKTCYARVKMTILAGRKHTCIHPTVRKDFDINDACDKLVNKRRNKGGKKEVEEDEELEEVEEEEAAPETGGCHYKEKVKEPMTEEFKACIGEAWDIEDLVKAGNREEWCPYFRAKHLYKAAELILCPYNYLVDPRIRKAMGINLEEQVIILDEAHNIEDFARDAASGCFMLDQFYLAIKECERVARYFKQNIALFEKLASGVVFKRRRPYWESIYDKLSFLERSELLLEWSHQEELYYMLKELLSRLALWSETALNNSSLKIWTGKAAMDDWEKSVFIDVYEGFRTLVHRAITTEPLQYLDNFSNIIRILKNEKKKCLDILNQSTRHLFENIFLLFDFMRKKDSLFKDDYRISVTLESMLEKNQHRTSLQVFKPSLNIWCLNPGVCFDELLNCRSIVLTSGTLSPLDTFASELGTTFPITLEANHVIDKSQVWVGTLSKGPGGGNLNGSFKKASTHNFQDGIGQVVLKMCQKVPHGILVFFPSYRMLNNMVDRWKATRTWQQILDEKEIVVEPRAGDQLDSVLNTFYRESETGSIMLAVYRGKVSEGLDFADNNARAVICVGIPFPALRDTLVELKRQYNDDKKATNANILSGQKWYEVQAFRALNQALGRCIRHRNDWGAILMVDERFNRNTNYVNSLSKWVRGNVTEYSNCYQMVESLQSFITDMKKQKFQLASVSQSPSDGSGFITSSCSKENNEIHPTRRKLKIEYEYAPQSTFDILSESESESESENWPFLW